MQNINAIAMPSAALLVTRTRPLGREPAPIYCCALAIPTVRPSRVQCVADGL